MGIKGLTRLIEDECPGAVTHTEIKTLFGRKIALDASTALYQFLVAVRQQDGQQLQNEAGETTSHLMGFFHRTIRMVENGIKPAYVFDGKPPQLKSGVLAKRFANKQDAKEEGEEAKEIGTAEDMDRLSRRSVKVTRQHNEECRRLLGLMGIPFVIAPSEAEAQCAELARGGLVYGAGSEDMDTLTFNAPRMLKHLTFSEQRKLPVDVIELPKVLEGLQLSMEQFVEVCMLSGCDYLEPLKKVAGKTALKLIRDHGDMESALAHLGEGKNPPPEDWPWREAKELFMKPDVTPSKDVELKWESPDVDGLVAFLVTEKGFNEERVRKGADKLRLAMGAKQQGRLDGFFTVQPKSADEIKRKAEDEKEKHKAKRAKLKEEKAAKKGGAKKK